MSKKLMIYDISDKSFIGFTWKVAAAVFKSYFDKIIAIKDWKDCQKQLLALKGKYDEVQYWGHGSPGFIYAGGESSTLDFWETLATKLNPRATVWLRVCSFAATSVGKTAMNQIAQILNAKILAHTHIVGTWGCQSGLKAVSINKLAQWSVNEGVDRSKTPADLLKSAPWLPQTVLALVMTPPTWADNK